MLIEPLIPPAKRGGGKPISPVRARAVEELSQQVNLAAWTHGMASSGKPIDGGILMLKIP
jgi:hypothetical protein